MILSLLLNKRSSSSFVLLTAKAVCFVPSLKNFVGLYCLPYSSKKIVGDEPVVAVLFSRYLMSPTAFFSYGSDVIIFSLFLVLFFPLRQWLR